MPDTDREGVFFKQFFFLQLLFVRKKLILSTICPCLRADDDKRCEKK